MTTRVQCGITAGLAIVGASVLAVAPLTLPMPSEAAPITADVQLSATSFEEAAGLFVESGVRAGTGVALAPISPVLAGVALAYGDEDRAYSVIRNSIDAPLWAADPAINALAGILPAPVGGGTADNVGDQDEDGLLVQLRDCVQAQQTAFRNQIRGALGATDSQVNTNYAGIVGAGLLASGERFVASTAGAPLGLLPIVEAITSGSEEELYVAIRQYIDAPLYIADPTIDGLALALPKPLGGTDLNHETPSAADGQLAQFRDDVLWRATAAVRTPIANVLGVDPNLNTASTAAVTNSQLSANKNAPGRGTAIEELVTGSGKSNSTTAAGKTVNNRPISTAVKAVNNQLKDSAERIDRTVKKITGTDQKKASTSAEGATN